MGRKSNPIADPGPIGQFAQRLRDRRDTKHPRPSFREMARGSFFSHSVLAEACAGKKLPTEEVTVAFVTALGAGKEEIRRWKTDRLQVQESVGQLRRKLGDAAVVVPTHSPTGHAIRPGRLRPVELELAGPEACVPNPEAVRTADDLRLQLRILKIAVGNPSLRTLAMHMSRMPVRASIGASTLSDLFSGKSTPNYDTFEFTVRALIDLAQRNTPGIGADQPDERPAWVRLEPWLAAWRTAEYNRVQPDRMRRAGNNNIYLMSSDQDLSPAISVFAVMAPSVAAGLLIGMAPEETAGILKDLPVAKSRDIIRAMEAISGKGTEAGAEVKDASGHGTVLPMTPPRQR